ncbi:hypothetical protein CTZ40_38775 [Streptomyces rimosus]|nr:hypothetical protein CTZ40_38775 [Streptomyces rimosus]QEV80093.1 hypothetical protein CP984_38730 [Streptomyces rimosus]
MVLTMAVARLVLQRGFRRRRQPFRAATCSPRQGILAWVLLCRRCRSLRRRPRKGARVVPPAHRYALSVQHFTSASRGGGVVTASTGVVASAGNGG